MYNKTLTKYNKKCLVSTTEIKILIEDTYCFSCILILYFYQRARGVSYSGDKNYYYLIISQLRKGSVK